MIQIINCCYDLGIKLLFIKIKKWQKENLQEKTKLSIIWLHHYCFRWLQLFCCLLQYARLNGK